MQVSDQMTLIHGQCGRGGCVIAGSRCSWWNLAEASNRGVREVKIEEMDNDAGENEEEQEEEPAPAIDTALTRGLGTFLFGENLNRIRDYQEENVVRPSAWRDYNRSVRFDHEYGHDSSKRNHCIRSNLQ
jgi:hypothetical protein